MLDKQKTDVDESPTPNEELKAKTEALKAGAKQNGKPPIGGADKPKPKPADKGA